MAEMLWQRELPPADLVIRGARVLDPTEGIDARLDVRIDGGTIAEVAEKVDANLLLVRARREAALGGHAHRQVHRLFGGQGGVAQGHGAHARCVRP